MKVILLEDVKTLGKKGDIVNVNDGYARNFILPRKLGLEANGKNLNDLKLKQANEEKKAKELLESDLLKISDVAMLSGYNDVSRFIQYFKKTYGVTPEEYRGRKN